MRISRKKLEDEIWQIRKYTGKNVTMDYIKKELYVNGIEYKVKSFTDAMIILEPLHVEAVRTCISKYGNCIWH